MTDYQGPERRADAQGVAKLRESVQQLADRVQGMTEALEDATAASAAAQQEVKDVRQNTIPREELDRRRRRSIAAAVFASLMIIGLGVALVVAFVGLHREHRDFVDLRDQSFNSCQTRNAQALNSIAFYKAIGGILVEANKQKPSPATQRAVDAFTQAVRTVPPPVDCNAVAHVGRR